MQTNISFEIPGYDIIEKLGQGSMGDVYCAKQIIMDRMVAIKVLNPRFSGQKRYSEKFVSEAKLVARLNHTNIIKGIAIGEHKGLHYFIMEFINGETLQEKINNEGFIPEKVALEIVLQISDALKYIKQFDIVHRDIKPANIILNFQNIPKLADLGLGITKNNVVVGQNNIVGTPHYISPEQAQRQIVDFRSDIYSLGATLFHLVTGRVPFEGANSMVVMTKHITEELINPREIKPDLSKGISDLLQKMMAKEPAERYQTTEELIQDIKCVLEKGVLPISTRINLKNKSKRKGRRYKGRLVRIKSSYSRRKMKREKYNEEELFDLDDSTTFEKSVSDSEMNTPIVVCEEMLKQAIESKDFSQKESFLLKAMSNRTQENDLIALEAKCRYAYLISVVRKDMAIETLLEIVEDFSDYFSNKFYIMAAKKLNELNKS